MLNRDKRKKHKTIEELIDILEKHDYFSQTDILSILYEIQDIKDQIETMDNEMRGYDP